MISTRSCPDPSKLFIKGSLNGKTMQQSSISYVVQSFAVSRAR